MLSDFSKWLFEDASEPRKSATMNCWEAVLLGAFKAKAISKDDILKVYQSVLDVNVQVKEFKGQKDELEKQPFKNSDEWREKQKEISAISDAIAQLDQLWPTLIEKFLVQPPRYEFDPDDPNSTRPVQGDIIFLDSMSSHVALALGNTEGSPQMLSLWNQPDNNDFLQKISVSDLIGAGPPPFRSRVYFYRPGWQ
jgi:hypothetical protein